MDTWDVKALLKMLKIRLSKTILWMQYQLSWEDFYLAKLSKLGSFLEFKKKKPNCKVSQTWKIIHMPCENVDPQWSHLKNGIWMSILLRFQRIRDNAVWNIYEYFVIIIYKREEIRSSKTSKKSNKMSH